MAKYKLTITDLASGKVVDEKACDGIAGTVISRESADWSAPTCFTLVPKLPVSDVLSMLMALDTIKAYMLKADPVLARSYAHKDKIIRETVTCNIDELKKQAGLL